MVNLARLELATSNSGDSRSNPTELQVQMVVCSARLELASIFVRSEVPIQFDYEHKIKEMAPGDGIKPPQIASEAIDLSLIEPGIGRE